MGLESLEWNIRAFYLLEKRVFYGWILFFHRTGQITWVASDGNDAEIYMATPQQEVSLHYKRGYLDEYNDYFIHCMIKVVNESEEPLNLNDIELEYLFEHPDVDISLYEPHCYWFSVGGTNEVSLSFTDFGEVCGAEDLAADRSFTVSFSGNRILQPGEAAEVQVAVNTTNRLTIYEQSSWSYLHQTYFEGYTEQQKIIAKKAGSGEILWGYSPCGHAR